MMLYQSIRIQILVVLIQCGVFVHAYRPFDELIIFGDSLSDTGNLYRFTNRTWPIVPPYYRGQYCNGRNWVEQLASYKKHNYAYVGATTDSNFIQGYTKMDTIAVPGVRQQVAKYYDEKLKNKTVDLSRTLFIVWAGGNDFNQNATIPPSMVINSLMNSIKDLLSFGAKKLLVFNQPPINAFPYVRRLGLDAYFTYLTKQINDVLTQKLTQLQANHSDACIYMYDVHTLVNQMINNTTSIKFENVIDRCWTTVNMTVVRLCKNPKTYVYVDSLHFTSTAHRLIANGIRPFLVRRYRNTLWPGSLIRSFK